MNPRLIYTRIVHSCISSLPILHTGLARSNIFYVPCRAHRVLRIIIFLYRTEHRRPITVVKFCSLKTTCAPSFRTHVSHRSRTLSILTPELFACCIFHANTTFFTNEFFAARTVDFLDCRLGVKMDHQGLEPRTDRL